MPVKSGMSTYLLGRPCSECGTESGFIDWCRICRGAATWCSSPDWIVLWVTHFVALAWALEFERNRYKRIQSLVKALRPKMPGFHKFRSDHRSRVVGLLVQALLAIITQAYWIDWLAREDTPIWTTRWLFTGLFLIGNAHPRIFLRQTSFYCQDPAKVQQSISADSADGPFYLYREDDWKRYPTLEALIETLKPKSQ